MKLSDVLSNYFSQIDNESSKEVQMTLSESFVPISPSVCSWQIHQDPERFSRKFTFQSQDSLIDFIVEVLNYEKSALHSGEHKISDKSVIVEVYTHDLNRITELDQEYTRHVDMIYRDVLDFVR
tara:strand:+ start:69 stop:440 length:372 start_codon:yes stop_codon:yes gene_type:complete